jgi:hypothetical protein
MAFARSALLIPGHHFRPQRRFGFEYWQNTDGILGSLESTLRGSLVEGTTFATSTSSLERLRTSSTD